MAEGCIHEVGLRHMCADFTSFAKVMNMFAEKAGVLNLEKLYFLLRMR